MLLWGQKDGKLGKRAATKLDDLSLIPRTHRIKGKSALTLQCRSLTSSRHCSKNTHAREKRWEGVRGRETGGGLKD